MLKLTRDESAPSAEDFSSFTKLVDEVLGVRRHIDLMRWLQGDLQKYLPHVLIAAGDFHLRVIHYDVVSAMPVFAQRMPWPVHAPLLTGLFNRWIPRIAPFSLNVGQTVCMGG